MLHTQIMPWLARNRCWQDQKSSYVDLVNFAMHVATCQDPNDTSAGKRGNWEQNILDSSSNMTAITNKLNCL